jgi:hypothetical protein
MIKARCAFCFGLLLSPSLALGQDGFVANWLDLATQTIEGHAGRANMFWRFPATPLNSKGLSDKHDSP